MLGGGEREGERGREEGEGEREGEGEGKGEKGVVLPYTTCVSERGVLTACQGGDVHQVKVRSFFGHNTEAVWSCR